MNVRHSIANLHLHAVAFPACPPDGLDLLARLLKFDQRTRITVDEALAHPYLSELHSRAGEPVAEMLFDWRYEESFPDEMPKQLMQVRVGCMRVAPRRGVVCRSYK